MNIWWNVKFSQSGKDQTAVIYKNVLNLAFLKTQKWSKKILKGRNSYVWQEDMFRGVFSWVKKKSQFNFLSSNVVNVFKWDGNYNIHFFIKFRNKWLEASVFLISFSWNLLIRFCYSLYRDRYNVCWISNASSQNTWQFRLSCFRLSCLII